MQRNKMTPRDYYGLNETKGTVGLEIEMEFKGSFMVNYKTLEQWRLDFDGSLKDGVELVLAKPCEAGEVQEKVNLIRENLKEQGTKISPTIRAGIHVHVNVQDMTFQEIYKYALCYYCFETVLTKFCGVNRTGNLFCLPLKDAEGSYFALEKAILSDQPNHLNNISKFKYSALNLTTLAKYGSAEFRQMGTRDDIEGVEDWVELLLKVKDWASKIDNPEQIAYEISYNGPDMLLKKIVGDKLFKKVQYTGMESDIMSDFRNIQPLIFLGDWE